VKVEKQLLVCEILDSCSSECDDTYIHTYIASLFINPYKPLGFGYETCLKNLTNITDTHKTNTYTYI